MEAALVLPMFLFAIIVFLYFIQIFIVQETIQAGITEVAKYSSKYAYVYKYIENYESNKNITNAPNNNTKVSDDRSVRVVEDSGSKNEIQQTIQSSKDDSKDNGNKEVNKNGGESDQEDELDLSKLIVIDNLFYKQKLKDYINEKVIDNSCVVDGFSGIDFFYSDYMSEDDMIDIVVKYKVHIPGVVFKINNIQLMQRVRVHGWVGFDRSKAATKSNDSKEDTVFITETGTVYHSTRSCTHLKLSIRKVLFHNIDDLRNAGGGKYKECEICGESTKLSTNSLVYVTSTGDRYHTNPSCSGLKRTIIEIPLSEIGNRTPCKRCYKN